MSWNQTISGLNSEQSYFLDPGFDSAVSALGIADSGVGPDEGFDGQFPRNAFRPVINSR